MSGQLCVYFREVNEHVGLAMSTYIEHVNKTAMAKRGIDCGYSDTLALRKKYWNLRRKMKNRFLPRGRVFNRLEALQRDFDWRVTEARWDAIA